MHNTESMENKDEESFQGQVSEKGKNTKKMQINF